MASDLDLLIGKWTVKVKTWNWEYEFFAGNKVTWRDLDSGEKGVGSWATSSKLVNIAWHGSATKESWLRPLTASSDRTWYEAPYFRGKYRIAKVGFIGPPPPSAQEVSDAAKIDKAWNASRAALSFAATRLRALQSLSRGRPTPAAVAPFRRDIAVISRRLFVPADIASPAFQSALARAITLIDQNSALPKSLRSARGTGKCADPRPAFAWTTIGRTPPDTELCISFFDNASDDLRRDVVTHEYFHTLSLLDVAVSNTSEAFRNANTLAQVVAFIVDRGRQRNSDGNEAAVPPLPTP
jgi:hypothetical protein